MNKTNIEREKKYYAQVLDVTQLVKQKEKTMAFVLMALSFLTASIHYFWLPDRVYFLLPVIFFGLAVCLIFKRDQDIKLGGISTYALLLYYILDNVWVLGHFIIICFLGVPLVFALVRRGFIGPLALYALTIFMLPVSAISYQFFGQDFYYPLVSSSTFKAQEVIYIFLPLIYIHTSVSIKRRQFIKESLYFLFLLAGGALYWIGLDRFFRLISGT